MATGQRSKRKMNHPYITRKKGTCGGKPIIAGTRIKVSLVAVEYDRMGLTPDEIIQTHPHLTLPQIHDALSYYYENIQEINRELAEERKFVKEMKKGYVSVLERKRGRNQGSHG